jgi:hypothetical protein
VVIRAPSRTATASDLFSEASAASQTPGSDAALISALKKNPFIGPSKAQRFRKAC